MKYYKIIQNNNFIGVVNSLNFIRYQPYDMVFISTNETMGEFIEYKGKLYRDTWMVPTPNELNISFEQSIITEIDEETYSQFHEAIINNETIDMEEAEPVIINIVDPIEEISLDFIKENKIKEMSYECRMTIEQGFDLELRGEMHHFSLTTQDYFNLMRLSALVQTQKLIPYHADGEVCTFFTPEEINQIITTANEFKIYQTTYYNALKAYINALDSTEDILAIQYGIEIPEEYKTDALKIIES